MKLRDTTDQYHEEQRKVQKLSDLVQELQKPYSAQSKEARLIELTK